MYLWIFLIANVLVRTAAQGLDLSDAFDDINDKKVTTKAPSKPKAGGGGGGEFDLNDAFGKEPTPAPRPGAKDPNKPSGGGLDLLDAFGPDTKTEKPKVVPPKSGGAGGGNFGDDDLAAVGSDGKYNPDAGSGKARAADNPEGGGADQPQGSGQLAGIISAVGVAIVGAASSYFAYQKKKLCFGLQGGGDPESGMKGQRGTKSEPQVLSNLLRVS